jgi:hypothetical protein
MKKSVDSAPRPANLKATTILDIDDHRVQRIAENLAHQGLSVRIRLQKAHILLISLLRPVYSVDEWQPTSKTLHKKRGSCSQRMACLEAVARSMKIPTRMRAIYVKGSFWYSRFRLMRPFIPNRICLSGRNFSWKNFG